jgi:hypothetical protein
MKEEELTGATFEEDNLVSGHAIAIPGRHTAFKTEGFAQQIVLQTHKGSLRPWPTGGAESSYYQPFTWLLNSILGLAKGPTKGRFSRYLH